MFSEGIQVYHNYTMNRKLSSNVVLVGYIQIQLININFGDILSRCLGWILHHKIII